MRLTDSLFELGGQPPRSRQRRHADTHGHPAVDAAAVALSNDCWTSQFYKLLSITLVNITG